MTQQVMPPPNNILGEALTGIALTPQQTRTLTAICRYVPAAELTILAQLLGTLRQRVRMGAALLEEVQASQPTPEWGSHITSAIAQAQGWVQEWGSRWVAVPLLTGVNMPPTAITATSIITARGPVLAYLQRQSGRQHISVEAYPQTGSIHLGVHGALEGVVELSPGEMYGWMAAVRRHGAVHLLHLENDGEPIVRTECGRWISRGETIATPLAWDKGAISCPRCPFPAGAGGTV